MNAREQAQFDMIKRVVVFGTNNLGEISAPVPPKKTLAPGQTLAQQIFEDLSTDKTGLLAQIGQTASNQQGATGDARGSTTSKAMLREELLSGLRGINRTAGAIADANKTPEMLKKFRMPYSVSDITFSARAEAMADAAETMSAEFVKYYHAESFADDLRALVTAFGEADESQGSGQQTQVGATATFGPLLRQAMTKVKQLDAFMQNFYKGNATRLGEWATASHVQRAAKRSKEPAPAVTVGQGAPAPAMPEAMSMPMPQLAVGSNGSGGHAANGAGASRLATV